ncbi:MAG: SGNH/GDSL hydrolase family protein [Planctomycetota bacterium]
MPSARNITTILITELLLLGLLVIFVEAAAAGAIAIGIIRGTELRFQGEMVVRPHPFIGFSLREGATRAHGDEKQVINFRGYRGRLAGPKTPNEYRILCVGDSVMYGDMLGESDTLPAQLEEILKSKVTTKKVTVINGGVLAYTSAETLVSMALRGIDMRPDAVIFYEGPNDVAPRLVQQFRPDYSHYRSVWEKDYTERADRSLEFSDGYVALRWLANVYPAARQIDAFTVRSMPKITEVEKKLAFFRSGNDAFLRNEAAAVALARASGARSLIVSAASNDARKNDIYYLTQMFEANKREQDKVAKKQGANFLELPSEINKTEKYFRDHVHFSKEGARAVAEIIAREMEALGWIPK